jgi:hypothetical protein
MNHKILMAKRQIEFFVDREIWFGYKMNRI